MEERVQAVAEGTTQAVIGSGTFFATLSLSQLAQGVLGITRSYFWISSGIGCASVVAGCVGTGVATELVNQVSYIHLPLCQSRFANL